ncbi:MAG: SoxR reducing system RseC family protein [Desulfobacterales bacterium]|nr:SoxR reducing system RseC family protein [Desulfobacterales bacterium]
MITETGVVTHATEEMAWVKTLRRGACEHCQQKDNCGTSHEIKELTVTVKNTLDVKAGDNVVLGIETRPMMFLSFFLYVFPIICLVIGSLIGDTYAPRFNLSPSAGAMLLGFSCFAAAFLIIRKKHATMSKNDAYKPFLIRKKKNAEPPACKAS